MDEEAIIEMILHVESQNDCSSHVKLHKPNLGPYHSANPQHCMDCGKPWGQIEDRNEPCPDGDPFAAGGWDTAPQRDPASLAREE